MKMKPAQTLAAFLLLLPALAEAHPGHGAGASLLAGAVHPLLGADHLFALVAAGLLAWRMDGRARIAIAMAFPMLMVVGAGVGLAGIDLAVTEVMILVSIAVLAVMALKPPRRLPAITVAVTALFALFHGHAHGLEAGDGIAGPSFVAGMALMSALVIGGTVFGAQFVRQRLAPPQP